MKVIYNAGIAIYAGLAKLASYKNDKAARMVAGHKDVFEYLERNRKPDDRYIWFHAASLGEFEQGRPLIEKIRQTNPEYKVLITFFSPSGYEVRKNYQGADMICYLPFDKYSNVTRFLDIVRPEKAIFIKYEFWANYILELNKRNIPVYLVSAIFRKEQVFFKWYGGFFRSLLKKYDRIFVQDSNSKLLLESLDVKNVEVCGDTRFDRVLDIMHSAKELPLVEKFVGDCRFTMVAGSSWPKDEDFIISHFNAHPEMKLIIAPHEIHEEHIASIIAKLKRPYVRYSKLSGEVPSDAQCMIVDCFGLLSSIYRYGQVSYIGGGFGVGIHNTLEAAVYGIPVIWGTNYQKFREARELLKANGGFSIASQQQYNELMQKFMTDNGFLELSGQAAGSYVSDNSGATEKVLKKVL